MSKLMITDVEIEEVIIGNGDLVSVIERSLGECQIKESNVVCSGRNTKGAMWYASPAHHFEAVDRLNGVRSLREKRGACILCTSISLAIFHQNSNALKFLIDTHIRNSVAWKCWEDNEGDDIMSREEVVTYWLVHNLIYLKENTPAKEEIVDLLMGYGANLLRCVSLRYGSELAGYYIETTALLILMRGSNFSDKEDRCRFSDEFVIRSIASQPLESIERWVDDIIFSSFLRCRSSFFYEALSFLHRRNVGGWKTKVERSIENEIRWVVECIERDLEDNDDVEYLKSRLSMFDCAMRFGIDMTPCLEHLSHERHKYIEEGRLAAVKKIDHIINFVSSFHQRLTLRNLALFQIKNQE